jgi:peptide chain release factor 2
MRERQRLEGAISGVERLERELADQVGMIELGEAEGEKQVVADAEEALKALGQEAERRQIETMLSGEADSNDAYVEIHAGAGGTESQVWAERLARMYGRCAEQNRYKGEVL